MSDPVVKLAGVERIYRQGERHLHVLKGANLTILPGEIVALVGPSGAGKSTLLHVAGLLEDPDKGEVTVAGQECSQLSDDARTAIRRTEIGFVYQFHHLLPEFSAVENVMIPRMADGIGKRRAQEVAFNLVKAVGLADRSSHRPAQLSGGEQQRVAIARALSNSPMVLLADEPTGNLDNRTASGVLELLQGLVKDRGLGALIATHNLDMAKRMDRILCLENGLVETTG
jgi:lipoprotein-releasing system ATP-binding protein